MTKETVVYMDGFKGDIKEFREGDTAVIVFDKKGEHMIATEVRGLRNYTETVGTIHSTLAEKKEVTLKGVVKNSTYELMGIGTVWAAGKQGVISDLKEGRRVMVTYQQKGDRLMASQFRLIPEVK